jgi:hypothetical protein
MEPKPAVPFWLLDDIPGLPPEGAAKTDGMICQ